jgi:acetyltransferase-like isoleucine patch superfamily enzyme
MGYTKIGEGIFVHKEKTKIGINVEIAHCSIVGIGDPDEGVITIGDNVKIGAFCALYYGVTLEKSVIINNYCQISSDSLIGEKTQILIGKEIGESVKIGKNCIIGGNVADRTIIEDNVTYMGEIAHSHRDPTGKWDETIEESPIILEGSIIGVNALIIGPRKIGPCAYVGAGEIVKTDIPPNNAFINNQLVSIESFKKFIKTRCK